MHSDVSGESRKKVKRERKIRSHHFLESLVELEVYLLQVGWEVRLRPVEREGSLFEVVLVYWYYLF